MMFGCLVGLVVHWERGLLVEVHLKIQQLLTSSVTIVVDLKGLA